ncbi:MAG: nitroreductase, partial [Myxococcales bacterium]|nr:nitroreductase [Myxococcales bacterium]
MKSFLDLATNRRSVRKYKSEPVPEEVLMRILTAGQMAPSGNNSQPWRFIIVNDAKTKEELFKVAGRQEWILSAPLTIAIVADLKAKLPQNRMDEEISIDD